jgi:hypothetical protein
MPTLTLCGFDDWAMYAGVRYLYGFDYMAKGELKRPAWLDEFLELCVVAVHYKIDGLLDSAVKAAIRALTNCFSYESVGEDHFRVRSFLGERIILPDDRYHPHLLSILGGHLTKLYTNPHFQDLLNDESGLVRILLDGLVKEQALRESSALALR